MNKQAEGNHSVRLTQTGRNDEPLLPVLKRRFPFRLATTSYIIPDAILPNLRFLGPYVDEVELVLFESGPDSNLPSPAEIEEMRCIAGELDLTYNVHLPADIFLGDPDPALRKNFRQTLLRFYEKTLSLEPKVFILHLDSRMGNGQPNPDWDSWTERVTEEVRALMEEGIDPRRVALENLEYPLERILPLAESCGMSLCLDLGHMLRYGYELKAQLQHHLDRSVMIHLHGVRNGVDHLGLEWISPPDWQTIRQALESYTGGITLEVFSVQDLAPSLHRMQDLLAEQRIQ